MVNLIRWIVAFPVGIAASFAMHMLSGFAFSLGHGVEKVSRFWEATDMAGMPISGTYIMFFTRATTAAVLVGVSVWIIPKFKRRASVILSIIVLALSVALLIYLLYRAFDVNIFFGFGGWYRIILELVSTVTGAFIGGTVAAGEESNGNPA